MLLVFDRDFTYGQSFYLVITVEAKERLLRVGRAKYHFLMISNQKL